MTTAGRCPNEAGRLKALHSYGVLDSQVEEAFDAITRSIATICDVPIALISLVDGDRLWFKSAHGLGDVREVPRQFSFCDHAIRGSGIFEVPDARSDVRFRDNPLVVGEPHIRTYAGAPLVDSAGFRLGALCVIDTEPRIFTPAHRTALTELAKVVIQLLETRKANADAIETLRASEKRLQETAEDLKRGQRLARLGSWEHDVRTGNVTWSDQVYAILGLDRDTVEPSIDLFTSMLHPDDGPRLAELSNEAIKNRVTNYSYDFRIRRADGVERQLEELAELIWEDGELIRRVGTIQDVTAQRAILKELQRSEQSLADTQRIAGIGNWELDFATGRIRWSTGLYELTGLDPTRHPPDTQLFLSLIHPDDVDAFARASGDALSGGEARLSGTYRLMRTDGEERVIHAERVVVKNPEGRPVRVIGTVRDVTKETAYIDRLRRSEEFLSRAQQVGNTGSYEHYGPTGKVIWSAQLFKILGLDPDNDQPSAGLFLQMVHAHDRVKLTSNFAEAAARRTPAWSIEFRIVRTDGTQRILREMSEVAWAADGQLLRQTGVLQDVTEERAVAKKLRWSEDSLDQAQRIAKIGSWEADLTTAKVEWSSGLYDVLGVDPAKQEPDGQFFMSLIHPEDRARIARQTEAAFAGSDDRLSADCRIVRPDGAERIIHSEAAIFKDETGRVVRAVGTQQDVTEQKAVEKTLQAALASAQQANTAKSEFLANMSHELRTPLNAIIGFSEILASEKYAPSMSDRDRDYARDIHDSGMHLLDIINDVLEFSRIEAGRISIQEEWIDARSLLEWVAKLLEGKAGAKNLRLTVAVTPQAASFRGDQRLLRQALLNIVSNAIKFTPAGEVRLTAMRDDNDALVISVADTGIGMRPEDISVALTPFLQLENALQRNYDGIGLGLPLAKRFVELHGARFSVASELQKGTIVTIEMPGERRDAPA